MEQQELLYEMIFKRKSFHLFRNTGDEAISEGELQEIHAKFKTFKPLIADIKTAIKIVPGQETTCRRGQEYCVLFYSEKKDNYLQNIGYIGEQLDLYLASLDIGALWFGFGKTAELQYEGLDFVMMMAIRKVQADKFRKNMYKSKRKPQEEIWNGENFQSIGGIARFAPSSCNTQPWKVTAGADGLEVFRYKQPGKRGMMPKDKVTFSNRIDMGIFLLFIDLCLMHEGIKYDRIIHSDSMENDDAELTLAASYRIIK